MTLVEVYLVEHKVQILREHLIQTNLLLAPAVYLKEGG